MTVAAVSTAQDARQLDPGNPVESARHIIAAGSLHAGDDRRVGLELEFHLVDLAHPGRRPGWVAVQSLVADLPKMPTGSSVTFEPGGQIELSTPPHPDLVACVTALRADREALRGALAAAGFGAAPLGADPARPVRRINPHQRYDAMEQHFEALGLSGSGPGHDVGHRRLADQCRCRSRRRLVWPTRPPASLGSNVDCRVGYLAVPWRAQLRVALDAAGDLAWHRSCKERPVLIGRPC